MSEPPDPAEKGHIISEACRQAANAANRKCDPKFITAAQVMCRDLGATDKDLARAFNVSLRTIERWRVTEPEFAAAVALGKDAADDKVERSLYQRAMGYACEDFKPIRLKSGRVKLLRFVKQYPPDTFACIYWLNNRRPQQWRHKIELEANLKPADVTANPLSMEEWDEKYGNGAGLNGSNGVGHA